MLVFMVIQLAGSVGTYPLELSGSFVPYLHDWGTVHLYGGAFRSTIIRRRKYSGSRNIPDRFVDRLYPADHSGVPDPDP